MIAVETLARQIENDLNAAAKTSGIVYKIHTDMGQYKRALKTRTEKQVYTNGVLRIVDSGVVPSRTLTVATQEAELEICVQLPEQARDEEILLAHRSILNEYFAEPRVEPITEDGKTYSVGATYSLTHSGIVEQRPDAGTSFTFYARIAYSFIENGLSSYDCAFLLDGFPIPYTSVSITRRPIAEANPYSDANGRTTCVNTATALSFDFQVPAISDENNGASVAMLAYVLDNESDPNAVHELTATIGKAKPRKYKVVFGQCDLVVSGVENAGQNISLIEAAPVVGG